MSENNKNVCSGASKLIFSCSGAADVGNIADLVSRQLTKEGIGKMFCLAGIGGNVDAIITTTQKASKILAIDGCPLECAKKSLLQAGFDNFEHLTITNIGMEKGSTSINEDNLAAVRIKAVELLND